MTGYFSFPSADNQLFLINWRKAQIIRRFFGVGFGRIQTLINQFPPLKKTIWALKVLQRIPDDKIGVVAGTHGSCAPDTIAPAAWIVAILQLQSG